MREKKIINNKNFTKLNTLNFHEFNNFYFYINKNT